MQSLTSYEPISPKESKVILTGDNYYEWSEDMKTHLEGKNLLMCINFKTHSEYVMSKGEHKQKAEMKEEYERELRSAKRRYMYVEKKAVDKETVEEANLREEKNMLALKTAQEDLEDELVKINREWRPMRAKWIDEDERSVKDWEERNQKCRSILKKGVDASRKNLLDKYESAFDMWEALRRESSGTKLAQAMNLKRQMYKTEQGEEETLMSFLDRIELMYSKLVALGEEKLSERERCFLIVSSLYYIRDMTTSRRLFA
jgi:hypothetical protein